MEHSALHPPEAAKALATQFSERETLTDGEDLVNGEREISLDAEPSVSTFARIFDGDEIDLDEFQRSRHLYIIGATGSGKSTLLERVVINDINAGKPGLFLDPHGESAERVLDSIKRTRKVVYFTLADTTYCVRWNPIAGIAPEHAAKAADDIITATKQIFFDRDFNAPTFTYTFRNHLIPLLERGTGTLMDALRMMSDTDFREDIIATVTDPIARLYWEKEYPQAFKRKTYNDDTKSTKTKLAQLLATRNVRNVLDCRHPALSLRKAFEEGYFVVVNLAKGKIGEASASFIGSLLVAEANNALMELDEPRSTSLIFDEFQNYAPHVLSDMLAEIRKKGGQVVLAHQFASQIDREIFDSIMGNAGTIVSFRISPDDAKLITPQLDTDLHRPIHPKLLAQLPPFEAHMRSLNDDRKHLQTLLPLPPTGRAAAIVAQSRQRFSRPV